MTKRFHAEQFSGYFRRSLVALESREAEPSALRERLSTALAKPVDDAVIRAVLEHHLGPGPDTLEGAQTAAALRRARQWVMLLLIERDLTGCATLEEICLAMTSLAQHTTARAMALAGRELAERFGRPLDAEGHAQDLLAVAMGKAGAGELNVSSDLDLIFVFRDEGETEGGSAAPIASSDWMHRAARRSIEMLSEITADGFVFRVDTRLRPNGESGPLVASFNMLEQYFYTQGREWERFAWLKSRVIAGTAQAPNTTADEDAAALERIVTPFVFRRYLDYEAIAALRDLHGKIRAEVSRRSARDRDSFDVKLGRGGIREIEFTAQLFQIVRGGRDPALRDRRTLVTLEALSRRSVLTGEESTALASAYRLLRRTEHALQYREDEQTHRLPGDGERRAEVAAMLGMAAPDFDTALARATDTVAGVFDRLLAPAGGEDSAAPAPGGQASPEVGELDADVQRRIGLMREGSRYAAARPDTRAAVDRLLAEAIARRTGSAGLIRLVELLESVCRRPAYVALLGQYPLAFGRVLRILDWSKWPADYLMRHPVVLDELLDGQLFETTDLAQWADHLREKVEAARIGEAPDVELQMDIVREAHHAQVFRLMAQDLEARHSTERISDFLSELADRVLSLVIGLVWSQLRQRFRDTPRIAAIAYGRLGGKELGYASDLDLVFLYDDEDERATEAYSLLAQRVCGWLSTRTAAGLLFETDLRLRPNGQAGLLVSSVSAFERYQRESAWVWEHQALTRARFAAGDARIGEGFEAVRRSVLAQPRDPAALAAEVITMRRKMHEGHPNRSGLFDLKHDQGGMVDIEFIVQFLVLAHGAAHSELLDNAGNIALLGRAGAAGLIDATLASAVADAYRRYRQLQHRLRLDDAQYARVDPEIVAEESKAVSALWESVLGRRAAGA